MNSDFQQLLQILTDKNRQPLVNFVNKAQLRKVIPLPASFAPCSRSSQRVRHWGINEIIKVSDRESQTYQYPHTFFFTSLVWDINRHTYHIGPWPVLPERSLLQLHETDCPTVFFSSFGSDLDMILTACCPSGCCAQWSGGNNCKKVKTLKRDDVFPAYHYFVQGTKITPTKCLCTLVAFCFCVQIICTKEIFIELMTGHEYVHTECEYHAAKKALFLFWI